MLHKLLDSLPHAAPATSVPTSTPTADLSLLNPLLVGYHEETHPDIRYAGAWSTYSGPEPSGGSTHATTDSSATAGFRFEGTGVTVYFTQHPSSGQRLVCLDDQCQLVDTYAAATAWAQPVTLAGLPMGVHTLQIRSISTYATDLDAVRVLGVEPIAPVSTPSATATASATSDTLPTASETPTETPTLTETAIETPTLTETATETPSATPSETATTTVTPSSTPSETPTPPVEGALGPKHEEVAFFRVPESSALQSTPLSRIITYTYDGLYRLRSADYVQNSVLTQAFSYSYDLMGNRIGATSFASDEETSATYTYNTANQLVSSVASGQPSRGYTYDPNGNLTQITADSELFATYGYDAANRLVSYTDASTDILNTYAYNGLGDRYGQTVDGVTTNYLLDMNSGLTQVLGEFKPGTIPGISSASM